MSLRGDTRYIRRLSSNRGTVYFPADTTQRPTGFRGLQAVSARFGGCTYTRQMGGIGAVNVCGGARYQGMACTPRSLSYGNGSLVLWALYTLPYISLIIGSGTKGIRLFATHWALSGGHYNGFTPAPLHVQGHHLLLYPELFGSNP